MSLRVTNLVGFGAKRAAAAGGVEGFIGDSTSTSGTMTFHADAVADDLCVFAELLTSGTPTTPSGWTLVNDGTSDLTAQYTVSTTKNISVYWKILTAGDISTGSVTSGDSGNSDEMLGHFFRGDAAITAVAENDVETAAAANPAAITINASGGTSPLINVGFVGHSAGPSFTAGTAENTTDGTFLHFFTRYSASSPEDWTFDEGGTGGQEGIGGAYLELTT